MEGALAFNNILSGRPTIAAVNSSLAWPNSAIVSSEGDSTIWLTTAPLLRTSTNITFWGPNALMRALFTTTSRSL